MFNCAQLLTEIARARQMFGGDPPLLPPPPEAAAFARVLRPVEALQAAVGCRQRIRGIAAGMAS